MFTAHCQNEAKNFFWDSNDNPLYSDEKAAQDIIDEKPFAWLELPEYFSINSNNRSKIDDSEVNVDDVTVLTSKPIDSLSPEQREEYENTKLPTSTSASIDPSQTTMSDDSISEAMSMEGIEVHDEPLALD